MARIANPRSGAKKKAIRIFRFVYTIHLFNFRNPFLKYENMMDEVDSLLQNSIQITYLIFTYFLHFGYLKPII